MIIIIANVINVAAPLRCASSQVLSLKCKRSSRRALHETVLRRWLPRPRSSSLFGECEITSKSYLNRGRRIRGCRHCCQEYQCVYLIQRHLGRGKETLKFHLGLLRQSASSETEVAPLVRIHSVFSVLSTLGLRCFVTVCSFTSEITFFPRWFEVRLRI